MPKSEHQSVYRFVGVVSVVGLAIVLLSVVLGADELARRPAEFALLSVFLVVGELVPQKIPRHDDYEEITTSSTFALALLVTSGLAGAVLAKGVASAIADVRNRKPWWKATFNVAQYSIALACGWAFLRALGMTTRTMSGHFGMGQVFGLLVAAGISFLVNSALVGAAVALWQNVPVVRALRQDFAFQASTSAVLAALVPIVVVVARHNLLLVPLLTVPVAAVYQGLSGSIAKYRALHDDLTQLPNRALFRDRAEQAVVAARRSGGSTTLMLIDLDRFKEVNDTLGHHIGDVLLQAVGRRLRSAVRDSDTIARLGGDEFAVLLPQVGSTAMAADIAAKLLHVFEEPFTLQGWTFDIDASIGIAVFPEHGLDVDTLIQRADVAMYLAKEARSGYEFYSPDRDRHSPRRLGLLGELRMALDERQLFLHYQPKADVRLGGIPTVEALVRWRHPQHGLVQPDEFIPLAEHSGLIKPLTLYVLDEALRECRSWLDQGLGFGVAVNISVRNLYDPQFTEDVARLLQKWGIDPGLIQLEITENVIMADPVRAMNVLSELNGLGIGLALDDFGAGHTSLAHLRRLPISEIKIDKSFVLNMTGDQSDATIVRSIIDLARNLGLQVVAEGVESAEVWAQLASLGCDQAQGFYICRPVPAPELGLWMASSTALPFGRRIEPVHAALAQAPLPVVPAMSDVDELPKLLVPHGVPTGR